MGNVLKQTTFNPKAINKTLLLGKIDTDTRQWMDGVLTSCSLQVTSEPPDTWSWIVCDGDIDPEWIESLNSVLDDNRLLSLPSGWQIKFGPNVNFVFETHELSHASPATVSRLGIVLLNEEDFTVTNYLDGIVNSLEDDVGDLLKHYIPEYFYKAFDWAKDEGKFPLSKSNLSIVKTAFQHLYDAKTKTQFLVGLLNGLGSQLSRDCRNVFIKQVFDSFGEMCPNPSHFLLYDERSDNIESYDTDVDITFSEKHIEDIPLVKTALINHSLDLLRKCLTPGEERHFLLVAEHGSAKS
ncbi:cytoplasmic dynein 2 heavy chain 1-like, partial [Agrilus planipennis]